MKTKFLTILLLLMSVGHLMAQQESDDGVCDPASTIEGTTDPAPGQTTVCTDGSDAPTFVLPPSSLPQTEFVLESIDANGDTTILAINNDGLIAPTPPATELTEGNTVCVTAITYDQAAINTVINQVNDLCANPVTMPVIEGAAPGACAAVTALIAAGGVTDLQSVFDFAQGLGVNIASVEQATDFIDGLNTAAGAVVGEICYATTVGICYELVACPMAECTIDSGEPTMADIGAVCPETPLDVTALFGAPTGMFTDDMGNVDMPIVNYGIATGNGLGDQILEVVDAAGMADLTALMDGTQYCVFAVAYSQESLNGVNDFLCNTSCIPPGGGVNCAGDIIPGYCGGQATDLATFFDVVNTAFGPFTVQQAIDLFENNMLTVTVVGVDTPVDLGPVGFCADVSEMAACFTADQSLCPMAECTIDAGEPTMADAGAVCPTADVDLTALFDPPMGTFTDEMGNVDNPVVNYGLTTGTGPNDLVLDVVDAAGMTNLDGLVNDGEQVCVFSVAYSQAALANVNDVLCNTTCVPPGSGMNCLGDLFGPNFCANQAMDLATLFDGINTAFGPFTVQEVTDFFENGTITLNGTPIDLGAAGADFCADVSETGTCFTIDESLCTVCTIDSGEPTMTDIGAVCPDFPLNTTALFGPAMGTFTDDMGNVDNPVVNYGIATGNTPGDQILDVVDAQGMADLTALMDGTQYCVFAVAYSQASLNAVNDFLCNTSCIPPGGGVNCAGDIIPGYCNAQATDLAAFFDVVNTAFGPFTVQQAIDLFENNMLTVTVAGVATPVPLGPVGFCADVSEMAACFTIDATMCPDVINDMVCDPPSTIDPIMNPDPAQMDICANGIGTPTFTQPGSNLPLVDFVIEVQPGGMGMETIVEINNDGSISQGIPIVDPLTGGTTQLQLEPGDVVCVNAVAYTVDGLNDAITAIIDQCNNDPTDLFDMTLITLGFPGGCNDFLSLGGNNAADLGDVITTLATLGFTITNLESVGDAINQLNQVLVPLGTPICFAATELDDDIGTICYTVQEPMCTADAGEPITTPPSIINCPDTSFDQLFTNPGPTGGFTCGSFADNTLVVNYGIADGPNGADNLTSVVTMGTVADVPIGSCVYQVVYTQETFDQVIDVLCNTTCVPPGTPGTCLGDLINACGPPQAVDFATLFDAINASPLGPLTVDAAINFIENGIITDPATGMVAIDLNDFNLGFCADVSEMSICPEQDAAACNMMCSITPMATAAVCSDNGTPADPTDDTYTFSVTVNGDNTDAGATDMFTADMGAGGAYGDVINYGPFPIAGGPTTVTYTDADDEECLASVIVQPPMTCSNPVCSITPMISVMPVCNDNDTPGDATDDTYTFSVTVNGSNAAGTNMFTDNLGNMGTYGAVIAYGPFDISAGATMITYTDNDDVTGTCTASISAMPPATCSPDDNGGGNDDCTLTVMIDKLCDDNDTTDGADDMIMFNITVTATNAGASTTWTGTDNMGNALAGTYGVTGMTATYSPMNGSTVTFTITDSVDPTCTATASGSLNDCATAENIPTVGEWGLIILALMMSIVAIVGIRQRETTELTHS